MVTISRLSEVRFRSACLFRVRAADRILPSSGTVRFGQCSELRIETRLRAVDYPACRGASCGVAVSTRWRSTVHGHCASGDRAGTQRRHAQSYEQSRLRRQRPAHRLREPLRPLTPDLQVGKCPPPLTPAAVRAALAKSSFLHRREVAPTPRTTTLDEFRAVAARHCRRVHWLPAVWLSAPTPGCSIPCP